MRQYKGTNRARFSVFTDMRTGSGLFVSVGITIFAGGCVAKSVVTEIPSPPEISKTPVASEGAVPIVVSKMLEAYCQLMNDESLLDKGLMGTSRLGPLDPSYFHASDENGRERVSPGPTQRAVRDLRLVASKEGLYLGDGLFAATDHRAPSKSPVKSSGLGRISFWNGTKGARGVAFQIKNELELKSVAVEAAKAVKERPDDVFQKEMEAGRLYALAIRYERKRCLTCHAGAKLNDVAGVAAVVVGNRPPDYEFIGKSIKLPPPSSPDESMHMPIYPSSQVKADQSQLIRYPDSDRLWLEMTTSDSNDQVLDYYEKILRTNPQARVVRASPRYLRYEFGDQYFGTIGVRQTEGQTLISCTFAKQTDIKT